MQITLTPFQMATLAQVFARCEIYLDDREAMAGSAAAANAYADARRQCIALQLAITGQLSDMDKRAVMAAAVSGDVS